MKKFQFFRDEFFVYLQNLATSDGTVTLEVVEKVFAMAVETTRKKYGEEKKQLMEEMNEVIQDAVAVAFDELSDQLHHELKYQSQKIDQVARKTRPKSPFGP